jgi:beta-glucosidase
VNIYQGKYCRAGKDGKPEDVPTPVGFPITAIQWPVTPEALYWGPRFLYERYGKPIYITENGMTNRDVISLDGKVHDPQRIDFLHRYLRELRRAAADGVDVRGYFLWTVMDNFEWGEGYKERFGIVYVDYPSQRRIPKDSAYWYRDIIASNGATL